MPATFHVLNIVAESENMPSSKLHKELSGTGIELLLKPADEPLQTLSWLVITVDILLINSESFINKVSAHPRLSVTINLGEKKPPVL